MTDTKRFQGFPAKTDFTPIPNPFFSAALPHIDDLAELKVTLYIFWALYRRKGYPRFITHSELAADQALVSGMKDAESAQQELACGLEKAASRGTVLTLAIEKDGEAERLYFVNDEQSRRAMVQIESGEIQIGKVVKLKPASAQVRPNIFALYEQHIGLLTPMIAEELKQAENLYPTAWIEEAFKEAAVLNKRSWRYISRILERWASEGKNDGTVGQSSKEDLKPKDYLRKYAHLTRK